MSERTDHAVLADWVARLLPGTRFALLRLVLTAAGAIVIAGEGTQP